MLRTLLLALLCVPPALAEAPPPEGVRLSLARYESLMRPAEGADASYGRGSATIQAVADAQGVATVTVSFEVRAASGTRVPLLPAEVTLEAGRWNGSDSQFIRRDGRLYLVVPDGYSSGTVVLTYRVPAPDGGFVVPLPPCPGFQVVVNGAPEATVFPSSGTTRAGDQVIANVPGAAAVAIAWRPAGVSVHRADRKIVVSADGERATLSSRLEVELDAPAWIRVQPASLALTKVTSRGDALVTRVVGGWYEVRIDARGAQVLELETDMAVDRSDGQPRLVVPTAEVPITRLDFTVPGKRSVEVAPNVPLTLEVTGAEGTETTAVSASLVPSAETTITWTESRPAPEQLTRISTETFQVLRLGEGVLRSTVTVRYQILRGSVKELALQIPDDAVLYRVTGEQIEDWRTFAPEGDAPRQVRVALGEEREGDYTLVLELEAVVAQKEGTPIPTPIVRPLGSFRESGVVALVDADKVGFSPADQTGFTAVGQDALPADLRQALERPVNQAFSHIGQPGTVKCTVAPVKTKELLVDARTNALYSVKEGAVTAAATIQIDVKSGRSERVLLSFPEEVTVLGVIAPSLAKKGDVQDPAIPKGRKGYELRFAQALEGTIEVHVDFELVPKAKGPATRLPDVRVVGAELEEGSFGVVAETGIEVTPGATTALRRVDATTLPVAVRRRVPDGSDLLHAYTFAHAPWSLELGVQRHETVDAVTLAVSGAWFETTVHEDGQVVTRAVFAVRNDERQFLRLVMPADVKVWSVAVDGQSVKAVSDTGGALAVPVPRRRASTVEVIWQTGVDGGIGLMGSVALTLPTVDALLTDLQWQVSSPASLETYGLETGLAQADALAYRAPGVAPAMSLPPTGDIRTLLLTRSVLDPAEAAPSLAFRFVTRPPPALGGGLTALAVLALGAGAFIAARRRRLGKGALALLMVGALAAVAALVLAQPVEPGAVVGCVFVVVVAGAVGWTLSRRAG